MQLKKAENLSTLLFVFPALFLVAVFVIWPSISGILYAFYSWNGVTADKVWVGVRNFSDLMQDSQFIHSSLFTIEFTLVNVLLTNVCGLLLAFFLSLDTKLTKFLRSIFFLPNIVTIVVATFIWSFFFVNVFSNFYKITNWSIFDVSWFGEPGLAFIAILIVSVWITAGYLMLIYLAGFKSIDPSLLESARLEGAKTGQLFFRIQLPLILPAVVVCIFLTTLASFKVFELIFTFTVGGPFGSTQTIAINVYAEAFTNFNYGLASAKSVVLFAAVMLVTFLEIIYLKRREVEA